MFVATFVGKLCSHLSRGSCLYSGCNFSCTQVCSSLGAFDLKEPSLCNIRAPHVFALNGGACRCVEESTHERFWCRRKRATMNTNLGKERADVTVTTLVQKHDSNLKLRMLKVISLIAKNTCLQHQVVLVTVFCAKRNTICFGCIGMN